VADALQISGSADPDGSDWYVNDPLPVEVTVKDPSGSALSGADVNVALIDLSRNKDAEVKGSTGPDGTVTLSITAPEPKFYRVQAFAETSSRQGYAEIGALEAENQPPFGGSGTSTPSTSGQLDLRFNDGSHSITHTVV